MSITPEQFAFFLRRSPQIIEDAVGPALFAAAQQIVISAQVSITEGAVSGKNHVASLPGEAPNNDSAVLANNIEANQIEKLKSEVSSNAPYAADLEFGNSKIQPRPYMRPAAIKETPTARKLVEKAVKRGIREAMRRANNASR